jgi:ankyrin repeat protein
MLNIQTEEPFATAVKAIHSGNLDALKKLLSENPGLATIRFGRTAVECQAGRMSRTLLHVATDWPGNFPNSAATVALLIEHGADVNARIIGPHTETPLHWAASCDDVAALDALLDRGANIEAGGAVIGGGTPLADAVAFGQWKAARRLVERGARTTLWQAAGLGLTSRVEEYFVSEPPTREEATGAFWCACHGGQCGAAEYLLTRGADLNWIGWDKLTPLDAASRSGASELVEWLRSQGAKWARELQ